jgi:hypothetical protein
MMGREQPMAEVEVASVEVETAAAILCVIGTRKVWIPKSAIGEDSEVNGDGDSGTLYVAEWLAVKEGLV